MNDKGFADFEAQVGDTFDAKSFINANNDYMTLVTGSLSDTEGADAYLHTGASLTITGSTAAVPEPSTYAMIFGAIALGFAIYRRRK